MSPQPRALIVGLAGVNLAAAERAFLRDVRPCGVILFTRNFVDNEQLRRLMADVREVLDYERGPLVLIDQEGGRVQRLKGPEWPDSPPAAAFGALYRDDPEGGLAAARQLARWQGLHLQAVGINTNCAPCLDVPVAGAHGVIGDRAYAHDAAAVAALGRAVADGLKSAGVLPVIKHIPGHGRAGADSHFELPRVTTSLEELSQTDFAPFGALADLPAAMSAHVTFEAIDRDAPASTSPAVIDMVRRVIGFQGLLMSDDISMQALSGGIDERARDLLVAGNDVVLHCNGTSGEMNAVAAVVPELSGDALARYEACLDVIERGGVAVDGDDGQAIEQALDRVWGALRSGSGRHV